MMVRKKIFLCAALAALLLLGGCAGVRQPMYVLMYHDVVADGQPVGPWTVTVSQLREDLQYLRDNGYTTVLPSELAAGAELPEKPVLLTFDDGYASNYLLALPVLEEFQAKAVVALVVRYVDEERDGFLTWDMCRALADSGLVELGSHTYDLHSTDTGIGRLEGESRSSFNQRVLPDLQKSIDRIREELDRPVLYFAYPHGSEEPWAKAFLRENFPVIATTRWDTADLADGLQALPRYNIGGGNPASKYVPAAP